MPLRSLSKRKSEVDYGGPAWVLAQAAFDVGVWWRAELKSRPEAAIRASPLVRFPVG